MAKPASRILVINDERLVLLFRNQEMTDEAQIAFSEETRLMFGPGTITVTAKGEDGIEAYWREKNLESMDGLPTGLLD